MELVTTFSQFTAIFSVLSNELYAKYTLLVFHTGEHFRVDWRMWAKQMLNLSCVAQLLVTGHHKAPWRISWRITCLNVMSGSPSLSSIRLPNTTRNFSPGFQPNCWIRFGRKLQIPHLWSEKEHMPAFKNRSVSKHHTPFTTYTERILSKKALPHLGSGSVGGQLTLEIYSSKTHGFKKLRWHGHIMKQRLSFLRGGKYLWLCLQTVSEQVDFYKPA